jgi:hypothetical protein
MIERQNSNRWEMGSEFHWLGLPPPPLLRWPEPAVWYMLARHAVASLVQMKSAQDATLWLPSYFCPEVEEFCRPYCQIREYRDLPIWSEPDWASLQPKEHDIVLVVNYFGVRDGHVWRGWRERTPCVLLEDHSQDPVSPWALNSTADFAFASARKTLPIADGALLWSPRGLTLPNAPVDSDWSGANLKIAAMTCKSEYLAGGGTDALKVQFREMQLRGEDLMRRSRISAISPSSLKYIADGVPKSWRQQRAKNARHLLNNLIGAGFTQCMFRGWSDQATPFVLPILFRSERERDECQTLMRSKRIYCPVHWVCQTSDVGALDLSRRILSLPVDQRYTESDMDCVSRLISHAGRGEMARCEAQG